MNDNYWGTRIDNAEKFYKEWATQYKCDLTERYYKGDQWKGRRDYITVNYNPYTLNLVMSTIEIKLANMVFQKPSFTLSPVPGGNDWAADLAAESTEIKENLLNTIVKNPKSRFAKNIKKAARDSFFRFGLIEVGYAADWRNPLKEDPLLSDHGKEEKDNPRVKEDNLVPANERFYFKRINPKRFRVSVSDSEQLDGHEWVGYCEYYYTKLLKKTKGIKFPDDYGPENTFSGDYGTSALFTGGDATVKPHYLQYLSEGSITKCWHIWDLVEKKRLMLLDKSYEVLWEGGFDRLGILDLRWIEDFEGWYPVPPAFHWMSPQDEINEAREQMRSFRRRFTRKYQAVKGQITEEEVEKFASGPDGVVIEVLTRDAITEIANAPINPITEQSLLIGKDDFNIISGTSAEARGQSSDRETATAVKENAARAQIRESAEQMDFSEWVCLIGREALVSAQENLTEGMWVKLTTPQLDQAVLQDLQVMNPAYKYVKAEHIDDGYDFEIDIDVLNMTPGAMQAQQQSFVGFLALVHQFPEIAMSPVLIRKAAQVSGMRDEKVIHQMQQVAVLSMAAKAQQTALQQGRTLGQALGSSTAAAQQNMQGQNSNNQAETTIAQMEPPTGQQVQAQLSNQMVQ